MGKDRNTPFLVTIIGTVLALSIVSGALSGWWFSSHYSYRICTIDLKKVIDDKKKLLLEDYKKNPTEATAKNINGELADFIKKLDTKLGDMGDFHTLVIVKDAVLSGETIDVTDDVETFFKIKQ